MTEILEKVAIGGISALAGGALGYYVRDLAAARPPESHIRIATEHLRVYVPRLGIYLKAEFLAVGDVYDVGTDTVAPQSLWRLVSVPRPRTAPGVEGAVLIWGPLPSAEYGPWYAINLSRLTMAEMEVRILGKYFTFPELTAGWEVGLGYIFMSMTEEQVRGPPFAAVPTYTILGVERSR